MKKLYIKFIEDKYTPLFVTLLALFINIIGFRYYVFENIYILVNLSNLGGVGQRLFVTDLLNYSLIGGLILAVILISLTHKKLKERAITKVMCVWAVFLWLLILINPYNLQVLMPGQIMQNISMINFLILLLLYLINISFAVFSLLTMIISIENTRLLPFIVSALIIIAACFAMVFLKCAWSYRNFTILFALALLITNIPKLLSIYSFNIANRDFGLDKKIIIALVIIAIGVLFFIGKYLTAELIEFNNI
jgi:hypothetical protein